MKKTVIVILILILTVTLYGCAVSNEEKIDNLYIAKEEYENILLNPDITDKERQNTEKNLEETKKSIFTLKRHYAVFTDISDFTFSDVPYSSDDAQTIGKWFFDNLIYPLYCFEEDYSAIYVDKNRNFSSQEEINIINYFLVNEFDNLLDEKYSYLSVPVNAINNLCEKIFNEKPDSNDVEQYDTVNKSYCLGKYTVNRLLTPVLGSCEFLSANEIDVNVLYIEKTNTQVIYTETFIFERREDNSFFISSRTRTNNSFSLSENTESIDQNDIFLPDFDVIIPKSNKQTESNQIGAFLLENYESYIDSYNGFVSSTDNLSDSSLLNFVLYLQPDIDKILGDITGKYKYIGIEPSFLCEQASYYFGNVIFESVKNTYYNEEFGLYLYPVSDAKRVNYQKEYVNTYLLDGNYIRLETNLYTDNEQKQFIAKSVSIYKYIGDGKYSLASRRFNMHTATSENSVYADIVPVFPELYPDTSSSLNKKGEWLYETYSPLITYFFNEPTGISSESLAMFALERLFSTEHFLQLNGTTNSYSFPENLIYEQIKLYFGETDFDPQKVSFYDMETKLYTVNSWSVQKKEASGKVVKTSNVGNDMISVYVDYENADGTFYYETYVFEEKSDKTFRFYSVSLTK